MMKPTESYVLEHRGDIATYILGTKIVPGDPLAIPPTQDETVTKTVSDFIDYAFRELKKDLRNKRKLDFEQLFKGDELTGSYADEFTEQQILDCISYKAIATIFYEYAINPNDNNQWMLWGHQFRDQYEELLRTGGFQLWPTAPEVEITGQNFWSL
jgi:hypothetical protein